MLPGERGVLGDSFAPDGNAAEDQRRREYYPYSGEAPYANYENRLEPAEVAGVTKRIMVGPPEPDYYAIDAELAEAYSL